jgi:tryptophan-rich sensory protein
MNPMTVNNVDGMSTSGAELGPIEQLRIASKNSAASLLGAALGGFVPVATYTVAHEQLHVGAVDWSDMSFSPAWALVAGGLLYSAKTVWQWGKLTFDDRWKATGFVLLVEGVMVFSPIVWLSRTALGYLVAINAIATSCLLGMRDQADTADRAQDLRESEEGETSAMEPTSLSAATAKLLPRQARGADVRENDDAETAVMEATSPSAGPAKLLPRQARGAQATDAEDELYGRALALVRSGRSSISAVQRSLGVGYNKAAKLIERMEHEGVLGPQTSGRRLVKLAQLELAPAAASNGEG